VIQPLDTVQNGQERDQSGRFATGNRAAAGRRRPSDAIARAREAVVNAASPADLVAIVESLVDQAKSGNVGAAREILNRVLGPPLPYDIVERIEQLEARLAEKSGS